MWITELLEIATNCIHRGNLEIPKAKIIPFFSSLAIFTYHNLFLTFKCVINSFCDRHIFLYGCFIRWFFEIGKCGFCWGGRLRIPILYLVSSYSAGKEPPDRLRQTRNSAARFALVPPSWMCAVPFSLYRGFFCAHVSRVLLSMCHVMAAACRGQGPGLVSEGRCKVIRTSETNTLE